ncbi:MAG: Omp28-related outer membrane protein [Muribaculaceae bacterium]|nr:Omp28-related outer membrane protein [Muribaculaceae bacterium]
MRKPNLLRILPLALLVLGGFSAKAYNVSTTPEAKHVLFEEYTGVLCTGCPDGHDMLEQIIATYPGKIHPVSIHCGMYAAEPPKYSVDGASAIHQFFGVSDYPSAVINREPIASNRYMATTAFWWQYVQEELAKPAPVNLWLNATYDKEKGYVKLDVEGYFTGDSPSLTNYLTIVMTQSNIIGPQKNAAGSTTNYQHNHMLRAFVTPNWGNEMNVGAQGDYFEKTFYYEMPEKIGDVVPVPDNIEFVAFMTQTKRFVMNATAAPLTYGTFDLPDNFEDEEPGVDDPGKDDPGKDDPGKDDPGNEDDPGKDDPGKDDPGKEDPGNEDEPGKDDPGTGGDENEDAGVIYTETVDTPLSVEVYDINGRTVYAGTPEGLQFTSLNKGIYILKAIYQEKTSTKKIL